MDNIGALTTQNFSKSCRVCLLICEEVHSIFSELQHEENNLVDEPVFIYEILMSVSSMRVNYSCWINILYTIV